MILDKERYRGTAVAVVVAFFAASSGLPAFAEARAARYDPAAYLSRKAQELPDGSRRRQVLETVATLARSTRGEHAEAPPRPPAFDDLLAEVEGVLHDYRDGTTTGPDTLRRLRAAWRALRIEERAARRRLTQVGERFRARGVTLAADRVIEELHAFRQNYRGFRTKLCDTRRALHAAGSGAPAARRRASTSDLLSFLGEHRPRERSSHFDPHRLPFQNAAVRPAPIVSEAEAGPAVAAGDVRAAGGLSSTPPGPADVAETPEVRFTPDVDVVVDNLGPNAVAIFNWVRNHIDVVPLHNSVQGATGCLATRLCSDTDAASLTIALLRHAGIPARYVRGRVRMPIGQAMNWVGGATTPQVAGDALATGNFPATLVSTGGGVAFVDVERTWVRAWVDFIPSRGAVQIEGDTWVDMDPAFKQFAFSDAIDVNAAVPFDVAQVVGDATAGATVNPTTGQIVGIDLGTLESGLTNYRGDVETHLASTMPGFSQQDVNGARTIVEESRDVLPGTVPFPATGPATESATVPGVLVDSITFAIEDEFGFSDLFYTARLAELAEKDVALSYRPATQADEAALAALLPDDPNATIEDLPTSLPANAIDVVAELRVDGTVVATGSAIGLGNAQTFSLTFQGPDGTRSFPNDITAGEYHAVGLDLSRIGDLTSDKIEAQLDTTMGALQGGLASTLRRDETVGRLLRNTIVSWFADEDRTQHALAMKNGLIRVRLPSSGVFFAQLDVTTLFGIPSSVSSGGLTMDVDNTFGFSLARDGNHSKVVQSSFVAGQITSANEAIIAQAQYTTAFGPTQSVSTMVALRLAVEQGIPLVQIDGTNAATAIPQLLLPASDEAAIQAAVAAGQTVTVPRSPVSFAGKQVVGMMVLDPSDGSGAYLIGSVSGGQNLPSVPVELSFLVGILSAASFLFAPVVGVVLAVLVVILTIWCIVATAQDIRDTPCLDAGTEDAFIAIAALLPIIGAILTVVGLIPGVGILAVFVAVSLMILIYSILVNAAVLAAVNVASQAACRNNQLEDAFNQP